MDSQINSLVYDYLTSVGSKIANSFKKEVKPKALPVGSPGMKEIVSHFMNSPKGVKRKIVENGTPSKKKKQVCTYFIIPIITVRDRGGISSIII